MGVEGAGMGNGTETTEPSEAWIRCGKEEGVAEQRRLWVVGESLRGKEPGRNSRRDADLSDRDGRAPRKRRARRVCFENLKPVPKVQRGR